MLIPYFLFALEQLDRSTNSIKTVGGIIIAMEDPFYVGRMRVTEAVEDKSNLVGSRDRLIEDLQEIGEHPGAEVTRQYEEMFVLFEELVERRTTATFIRHDRHTSLLRRTKRYEAFLHEFVVEFENRNRQP